MIKKANQATIIKSMAVSIPVVAKHTCVYVVFQFGWSVIYLFIYLFCHEAVFYKFTIFIHANFSHPGVYLKYIRIGF